MSSTLSPSARAASIEPTLIRALRAQMKPSTIDFGLGQADLPVSEVVRKEIRREFGGALRAPYTPNAGLMEAREAVANHTGVAPEEVMLTCGSQEALAVAILGLVDPGDEVLVPDPGFPAYANLVRAAGAEPVRYQLRPPSKEAPLWSLDAGEVQSKLSEKTRLAIFNNPSNPTGSLHEEQALSAVLGLLAEKEIGWISDEIYEDYVWRGNFVAARNIAGAGPGLTLSGLSKSHHLMGWRLGWMLGPAKTLRALTPLHQHLVTCAPLPAQRAAIAALGSHREAMEATGEELGARRKKALEILDGLEVIEDRGAAGAFYLFLDTRDWLSHFGSTRQMAKALLDEEDVMVIPGEGFGPAGLGHLRLAYTIGGDELETGLMRLRNFLLRYR